MPKRISRPWARSQTRTPRHTTRNPITGNGKSPPTTVPPQVDRETKPTRVLVLTTTRRPGATPRMPPTSPRRNWSAKSTSSTTAICASRRNSRTIASGVRAEQRDTWARAQADLVRRLVESVDDLQRVALLDPQTASVRDIVEGVDLVERKLLRALADAGLEVLDPAGENFDPNVMEAVMMAPATSEDEDDTVDMVMQRGYVLGGHLGSTRARQRPQARIGGGQGSAKAHNVAHDQGLLQDPGRLGEGPPPTRSGRRIADWRSGTIRTPTRATPRRPSGSSR